MNNRETIRIMLIVAYLYVVVTISDFFTNKKKKNEKASE